MDVRNALLYAIKGDGMTRASVLQSFSTLNLLPLYQTLTLKDLFDLIALVYITSP